MNPKKLIQFTCLIVFIQLGCGKDKKLTKMLGDSEWNIDLYESYTFVSGTRDSAQDIVNAHAGFVKINNNGTGNMVISNGIFTDTYAIEKWYVIKNKKALSISMNILYINNNTHGTWLMKVLKNEETKQVWTRTVSSPDVELKNTYTLSLK